jgi:hypothetical protein
MCGSASASPGPNTGSAAMPAARRRSIQASRGWVAKIVAQFAARRPRAPVAWSV